jgi:hypothetical protein
MAWTPDDGQQPASPWLVLAVLLGYGLIAVVAGVLAVLGFRAVM